MTEHKDSFTDEERLQIEELKSKLSLLTENVLTQQDWNMVHQYLEKSTTQHGVSRDAFGLSNILTDMETALIVGQEMGDSGKFHNLLHHFIPGSINCFFQSKEIQRSTGYYG